MLCFRVASLFARHICPLHFPPFASRKKRRYENGGKTALIWKEIKIFIPISLTFTFPKFVLSKVEGSHLGKVGMGLVFQNSPAKHPQRTNPHLIWGKDGKGVSRLSAK